MNKLILDVREKDEFHTEHVPNSIHAPLSELHVLAPGLMSNFKGRQIEVLCRSGSRAKLAKEQLFDLACEHNCELSVYEGGILKWKEENKPTITLSPSKLPILRQVHLTAGALIIGFSLLAAFVSPGFILGTGAVGLGLFSAGATGTCLMANLLSKMSFNRPKKKGGNS